VLNYVILNKLWNVHRSRTFTCFVVYGF
jgi:hypothetical protein